MMRSVLTALALALGAAAACSGGGSSEDGDDDSGDLGDGSYCATYIGRLRECGSLGSGRFACANYEDPAELCETECLQEASCSALSELACAFDGSVARCFQECIGISPFACDDGTLLSGWARCNGFDDCPNAEDELDCTVTNGFKCRNVDAFLDYDLFCDGREDCSDGSDEPPDCVVALECDGGFLIPQFEVCNGVPSCEDGADEPSTCATLTCN
jgi:hypothetical protein